MGTQSNLYVETDDNGYIGVRCRYDGYPEHMLEQLHACSPEEILEHILVAGVHGGYNLFSPSDNGSEFLDGGVPNYVYDPIDDDEFELDYIYVKRLDGSVMWREYTSKEWRLE